MHRPQMPQSSTIPTELPVLATGPGWIAVNKPPGQSIHNDPGKDLLAQVLGRLRAQPDLAEACSWEAGFSPSAVHRLDRETSGIVLIATQQPSAQNLSRLFAERKISKTYRAIVAGKNLAPQGEWNWPLTEAAGGRTDPAGPEEHRKDCITRFHHLRGNDYFTELELEPLTGRQHQLRRHAALSGHHLIGDRRYGNPKYADKIEKLYGWKRLFLHAEKLAFPGINSELIQLTAEVPQEFSLIFQGGTQ